MNPQTHSDTQINSDETSTEDQTLTPELVRLVAEKVYARLLEELSIEQERYHIGSTRLVGDESRLLWRH